MRPLTFALLVGFSNAAIASLFGGYSVSGHMNQKHYEFKVSEADILRTPVWSRDADFPPLPARKAQDIARRKMEESYSAPTRNLGFYARLRLQTWGMICTSSTSFNSSRHLVKKLAPWASSEFFGRVSPRIAVDGL